MIIGGTGKFAGLTGEYDFHTSDWYASVREGTDQGVGTKTGKCGSWPGERRAGALYRGALELLGGAMHRAGAVIRCC